MAGNIFVTGDCHGEFYKLNTSYFPEQIDLDKEDYLIICGDFGLIWDYRGVSPYEKHWLDWLEQKNFTTLFVDGNHENFERLAQYPQMDWHGGKVHQIRPSVYHLMRGQIFDLGGKKIFAMGGASSHDINAGVLEPDDPDFDKKRKRLDRDYIFYRVNHMSWWKEELPDETEYAQAIEHLKAAGNRVDYIISHCCASSTQAALPYGASYKTDHLTDFLERVKQETVFDKWYFGHYHADLQAGEKEVLLYEEILKLGGDLEEIEITDETGYRDYTRAIRRMYARGDYSKERFQQGDAVSFRSCGNRTPRIGKISSIHSYGMHSDQVPSFDIMSELEGEPCLYKEVPICEVKKIPDESTS